MSAVTRGNGDAHKVHLRCPAFFCLLRQEVHGCAGGVDIIAKEDSLRETIKALFPFPEGPRVRTEGARKVFPSLLRIQSLLRTGVFLTADQIGSGRNAQTFRKTVCELLCLVISAFKIAERMNRDRKDQLRLPEAEPFLPMGENGSRIKPGILSPVSIFKTHEGVLHRIPVQKRGKT